jgi:hypothetical protein
MRIRIMSAPHLAPHFLSDDAALQRQGLGLLFAVLMKPGQQSDHGISQS